MATYVLIPGADGRASSWNFLGPLLRKRGHHVVPVDLPAADPSAGLEEYAAAIINAIGDRHSDLVLVAHSLAGFTAPLVADRLRISMLILLNAMVPMPGESAGSWWADVGHEKARAEYYAREGLELPAEFDPFEAFFHDVPTDVLKEVIAMGEPTVRFDTLFSEPWPLDAWPGVPTRFLQASSDRFFPLEFQRWVVSERLGIPVEVMPGGHMVALSRPADLAERLERIRAGTSDDPGVRS
ncbi:MAG: alpha/beta hydrolase [Candidatus Dormibacteraeota bacterium]|nr:alpha/beta hydrolase [Candidatus Dormibacteraeota bacterium]